MDLFVKAKTYSLSKFGRPLAFVVVKVHPFKLTLKAKVTLANGEEFEVINQWASEEEFDNQIEMIVNTKMKIW